ncbi:MAG: NAD+ synthase, partial [Pseudomonadota bacterium]
YDVFDEARYFDPASALQTVPFKDEVLGISICEDAWNDPEIWERRNYACDPIAQLAHKGASLIINLSASPFHAGKERIRYRIIQNHAKKHHIPFVFVNQTGANDELIFDGRSMCVDRAGEPIEVFPAFKEQVKTVDMRLPGKPDNYCPQQEIEAIYEALLLGIRDYMKKCGFSKAVLGLSGGIDSAVVCCLAAAAVGKENVLGVTMPGPYSSPGSVADSRVLAENLGVALKIIPMSTIYDAYLETLNAHFAGRAPDAAEENIQARIRGNILMGLSNKFGHLLLSTGNKSELAVGYCTLYGDMAGGLAAISDVPKTLVYKLARFINRYREIIPNIIIEKAPSAELRPDQKDQDTLPPYEVLDRIINYYVDERYSLQDILKLPLDPDVVKWVVRTIDRNEYKRKQSPPGLKITSKAFGIGRRMVIAARYDF